MNVTTRVKIERQIVRKIVKDAIEAGYFISLYDGEATAVARSRSVTEIMRAIMSTDDDALVFSEALIDKLPFGWVSLVYGNDGWDVVSDYTANPKTEALLAGALALAEKLEEKYS